MNFVSLENMAGLDRNIIEEIDWHNAVANIVVDVRSDFILSPHFDAVYLRNAETLIDRTIRDLRAGEYNPRLPITFSVPKGNFLSRPGSILEPKDRLVHQAILETCLPIIEAQLDRTRSFSQVPSQREDELFEPSHLGWDRFQRSIRHLCANHRYILKADIANYFEAIPQHTVVNLLSASGVRPELVRLLEEQLLAFRQRTSTGILQGIYPSDLLGNFYLSDFDSDCELKGLNTARYVDDIFIGFPDELSARRELVRLIERLRQNGLTFNSQKTMISEANTIIGEEQEIDRLFDEARNEIEDHLETLRNSGYGFQGDWINAGEEDVGIDINLRAVRYLMDWDNATNQQKEKIERFCLPILRGADDDSAVESVLENFTTRPQLTRIYASYLTHFSPRNPDIVVRISELLDRDDFFCDYQRMYMVASLLSCERVERSAVRKCLQWLQSNSIGKETRAICAIFAAKFGVASQTRTVRVQYETEQSEYVRASILYAAQYFPNAEKRSAKRAWGSQSELNAMISDVI